ncbi:MAG: DUF2628 domain-containing protein, partial [Clostridia bacterium]|nr:DUF2628 domain-containing protein [Clostridia bacterium]
FFYEGLSCPVCGQAFAETDDIVACPDCGAPHHRACWQQVGHCLFADDHGTERQWRRDKSAAGTAASSEQNRCPRCGADNPPHAEFCGHCGGSLETDDWSSDSPFQESTSSYAGSYTEYAPFRVSTGDPCGGIPQDQSIEGETAGDLAAVVGPQSAYYIPRFSAMASSGGHVSWNWPAFLIPLYWLFYRKQYIPGALMLVFSLLHQIITLYVTYTYFYESVYENVMSPSALLAVMEQNEPAMLAAMLLTMLAFTDILLHVLIGLFGNRLYMRHCLSVVRRAKAIYPEGYRAQLGVLGGTSIALAVVAYLCIQFVPMMVTSLFM